MPNKFMVVPHWYSDTNKTCFRLMRLRWFGVDVVAEHKHPEPLFDLLSRSMARIVNAKRSHRQRDRRR